MDPNTVERKAEVRGNNEVLYLNKRNVDKNGNTEPKFKSKKDKPAGNMRRNKQKAEK